MLGKLLGLKKFIEKTLPGSKAAISNLITRNDDDKASLTVILKNEHLLGLQMNIIDHGNITSNVLNKGGLHLNQRSLDKLAISFIRRIRMSATTLRVIDYFHKASSFDSHINLGPLPI